MLDEVLLRLRPLLELGFVLIREGVVGGHQQLAAALPLAVLRHLLEDATQRLVRCG